MFYLREPSRPAVFTSKTDASNANAATRVECDVGFRSGAPQSVADAVTIEVILVASCTK